MTAARARWRFLAHARRLKIPDPVSEYLLGAIGDGTPVPEMMRQAALMGSDHGLDPSGLAAQVRKLLSWDYRKRPGDYARDPRKEPISVQQEDARAAVPGHHADQNWLESDAQRHMDEHKRRRRAASCCRYGYALPSYGTSYDRCGRYVYRGCLEHADDGRRISKRAQWRCDRPSCPKCYEHAIEVCAIRGTKRLVAGAILRKSPLVPRRRRYLYQHWIVSVDPSRRDLLKTPAGVDRYRNKMYGYLEGLGFLGGAAVYHPYRFKDGRQSFEPHFHVLAAGYIDLDEYLEKNGQRVMLGKMESHPVSELSKRTGGDMYRKVSHAGSAGEVYSILLYQLTHAGQRVPERPSDRGQAAGLADSDGWDPVAWKRRPKTGRRNYGHTITYFGDLAPNKFATKDVLSRSRDAERDIGRIVRSWQKRAEKRDLSVSVSVQPVTCPPRGGGAGGPGGPCGSMFDADPRTAKYGDIRRISVYKVGEYLRSLVAREDNAPMDAESTGGDGHAGGPAAEPYRYAVVRLRYYEKYGGVYVRSSYAVISLDPSTKHLCTECRGPLRPIVRVDGGGIPPPDGEHPEDMQCTYDDAADWTYYQPRGEHAGMGMPYYQEDGSPRWDTGIPNMPAEALRMPLEYYLCLQGCIEDNIVRYATAAMRRLDPGVDPDVVRQAVRHIYRAGYPDKARDGWEENLLADIRGKYAAIVDPMRRLPGQDTLDGDGDGPHPG